MHQSNVVSGIALAASLLALILIGVLHSAAYTAKPTAGSSLRVIGDCVISTGIAGVTLESAIIAQGSHTREEGPSMQGGAEESMRDLLELRVWTRREFDSFIFSLAWHRAAGLLSSGALDYPEPMANAKTQFSDYAVSIGRDVGCEVLTE